MKTMARLFAPASLAIALFGTIVAVAVFTPTPAEADPVSSGGSKASGVSGMDLGSGRKTGGKTRGCTDSATPNDGQTSGAANNETPGTVNSEAPTGKTPGGE